MSGAVSRPRDVDLGCIVLRSMQRVHRVAEDISKIERHRPGGRSRSRRRWWPNARTAPCGRGGVPAAVERIGCHGLDHGERELLAQRDRGERPTNERRAPTFESFSKPWVREPRTEVDPFYGRRRPR